MAIVTVGELLDRADEFEQRLQNYYAAIRDETTDDGAKLLSYYLSEHRRHLARALSDIDDAKAAHIRGVQLKRDVEFAPEKAWQLMEKSPREIRGSELLGAAVDYDTVLIEFYTRMLEQPLGPDAAALLQSLIKVEERDLVMLKKTLAMNYF